LVELADLQIRQFQSGSGMEEYQSTNELLYPQREAAFFYGLFLRGHSPEKLRQDIEVPPEVMAKWHRETEQRPEERGRFYRIVEFRRSVLAIFNSLIGHEKKPQHVQ
jgi:hypothetical protein